jgi:hypothetical protein
MPLSLFFLCLLLCVLCGLCGEVSLVFRMLEWSFATGLPVESKPITAVRQEKRMRGNLLTGMAQFSRGIGKFLIVVCLLWLGLDLTALAVVLYQYGEPYGHSMTLVLGLNAVLAAGFLALSIVRYRAIGPRKNSAD